MNSAAHIDYGTEPSYSIPLAQLIAGCSGLNLARPVDGSIVIEQICDDSRLAGPFSMFVAIRGESHDGHQSVDQAVRSGAVAVVVEKGIIEKENLQSMESAVIEVEDTRAALASLASAFYGNPASKMTMIGITGTNGKTTVSYIIEQTLRELGVQAGVIGTIEYRYELGNGQSIRQPAPLTTPDPLTLQKVLRKMADSGVSHVIMEASSHALQQHRLGSVEFDLSIFTNLSQDHLDYHRTMTEYFAAKRRLFTHHMRSGGTVVVVEQSAGENGQSPSADLAALCRSLPLITVVCGGAENCGVRLVDHAISLAGVDCEIADTKGQHYQIHSSLIGRFNINNLLAAFSALNSLGYEPDRLAKLIGNAAGAPGRIEPIRLASKPGGQPTVIIDYAHTPDALEKVLDALKSLPHERLICVFGCGGNRDQSKRVLMGEITGA